MATLCNTTSVLLFARLFPAALASQSFLHALPLARLQVEGVTLYLLDDVFLLHFAFESAQGILKRLTLLKSHFRQPYTPPNSSRVDACSYYKLLTSSQGLNHVSFGKMLAFASANRAQKVSRIAS